MDERDVALLALTVLLCVHCRITHSQGLFLFGDATGDLQVSIEDDVASSPFRLTQSFVFFNRQYKNIHVSSNGVLSFDSEFTKYYSELFPVTSFTLIPIIAPFWTDIDIRTKGFIYYRQTSEPGLLQRAQDLIRTAFPTTAQEFSPTHLFIATWDRVAPFSPDSPDEEATFQAVLVHDGSQSFVIFLYENIQWTTRRINIGFDAGDGVNAYNIAGALTNALQDIEDDSNIEILGVYIFRVDQSYMYPANEPYLLDTLTSEGGDIHEYCVFYEGQGSISITVNTLNDTASDGIDYIGITDEELIVQSGSEECFQIEILNDDIAETAESFQIILQYDNVSQVYPVIIEDDDVPIIGFEKEEYTMNECDQFVTICVIHQGGTLNETIYGQVFTTDTGTASEFLDYLSLFDSFQLPFGERYCINITIIDDTTEESDEEFKAELEVFSKFHRLGIGTATIKIHDDDDDTVFCSAETLSTASGTYNWPLTPAANIAILMPCKFGPEGQAVTRQCDPLGFWMDMDASMCNDEYDIIADNNITADNIDEFINRLTNVVERTDPSEETEENIAVVSDVLSQAAVLLASPDVTLEPETVDQTVKILSIVQEWNATVLEGEGSNIVQSYEFIINNSTQQENFTNHTVVFPNIALVAEKLDQYLTVRNGRRFTASINNGELIPNTEDGNADGELILEPAQLATIDLPASLFSDNFMPDDTVELVFTLYETAALFSLSGVSNTTVVGSSVLGATVVTDEPLVVNEEVEILLRIILEDNVTNHSCVFWDFGAAGGQGNWSSEGCRTERDDHDTDIVRCLCDHLTNFAVLVDICSRTAGCSPLPSGLTLALDIISIIGVSLSLASIVATLFTLLVFKKLRKRDATKFHVQLCAALFAMLLVFVIGIDRTEIYGGCVVVSALIQYFTLVAVMWMGAEAILMFRKLVIVFTQITTKHIIGVSIVCWALPIVPVLVPLAIDRDFMVTYQGTVNPVLNFCFIGNIVVFFGAFLVPIFAIILINCVVFVIVISVLIKHQCCSKTRHNDKRDIRTAVQLLIRLIGVVFLFGLTWLFGAFTVTGATPVFQILFAVFNSLQGFFIFFFFCVLSRDARERWKEILTCGRYRSESTYASRKSGGFGITPRNNRSTISTGTATGRSHYSSHNGEKKNGLPNIKQVCETDQKTVLDTSQGFTNSPVSSVVEQDSPSANQNDEVFDFITSENMNDFRYSQGFTPDRDIDCEYQCIKIDFSD